LLFLSVGRLSCETESGWPEPMKVAPIAAVVLLALTDMAFAGAKPPPARTKCMQIQVEDSKAVAAAYAAEQQVRAALKDPEAAHFSTNWHYSRVVCDDGPHEYVCGSVNAKNSFGGYSGNQLWLSISTGTRRDQWLEEEATGVGERELLIAALRICAKGAVH
jgi:hypothetical protein